MYRTLYLFCILEKNSCRKLMRGNVHLSDVSFRLQEAFRRVCGKRQDDNLMMKCIDQAIFRIFFCHGPSEGRQSLRKRLPGVVSNTSEGYHLAGRVVVYISIKENCKGLPLIISMCCYHCSSKPRYTPAGGRKGSITSILDTGSDIHKAG